MPDLPATIAPRLVLAHAAAWVGTPYHRAQAARGLGCDCVGLVRGIAWELTGRLVPAPGWRDDWSACGAPILRAFAAHLVPLSDPVPGAIAVYRVGPRRAAHVGILHPDGLVHGADYARRVVLDRWPGAPASLWALRAPAGIDPAPADPSPPDLVAVVYPCAAGAFAEICGPRGEVFARTRTWATIGAALDALAPIYPNIETMG